MNQQEISQIPMPKMDILMWHVMKLFVKNKKRILEKYNLTCSQFEILSAAYHFSKTNVEIIQIDLSKKANIDPMTTSTILRNLQKKGLITRLRNTVDTRIVNVKLTQDGTELFKKASKQIRSSSNLIYQDVNKTDLASQLLKLSEKLNKLNK